MLKKHVRFSIFGEIEHVSIKGETCKWGLHATFLVRNDLELGR